MAEFKCQACGAVFPTQDELMRHADAEHSHKHFRCSMCGAEFHSEAELQAHARSSHTM
ncbi:MAG: C2H2-type zinc finger protein [Nitrososphaerota archaeon]|nr:C2H2-type zinc finger protein [Nitrososphaerota archaeon]MDG7043402.1 C2H2-type zinc finger protein [Nitrososphaerota archaeon]